MVASGVLERNAGEKAAPKKMARSRSTRRDARTATRRLASEPAPRSRRREVPVHLPPAERGGSLMCTLLSQVEMQPPAGSPLPGDFLSR